MKSADTLKIIGAYLSEQAAESGYAPGDEGHASFRLGALLRLVARHASPEMLQEAEAMTDRLRELRLPATACGDAGCHLGRSRCESLRRATKPR